MNTLTPRDIREVWPGVRAGLDAVLEHGGDWRPEDVYAACVNGDAHLWMSDEGAFCVLQLQTNPFTRELELFIWAAWTPGHGPLPAYFLQVREIAREAGATLMRMRSTRKGWTRIPYWTEDMTEYTSEV